jgi:hypothetical protein
MITEEQEKYILDNYQRMSYQEIGNELGLHKNTVNYYVKKNGLNKRSPLVSKIDGDFIMQNYPTMTSSEIGLRLGITDKQVRGWYKNHCADPVCKRRKFNSDYFREIDTPTKAYWLGFIYADGYIVINGTNHSPSYEFGMELQEQDSYMIHALNETLGGVHLVQNRHRTQLIPGNKHPSEVYTTLIRVFSKAIVDDLHAHGIDFRKTYSNTFPIVDDDLFMDFLRGYIDGDGCVHIMSGYLGVHITSPNVDGLYYIKNKLKGLYDIESAIYCEKIEGRMNKYRLYCFRQDDVRRLLDAIYADKSCLKLKRKYDIYANFYGLEG